MSLSTTVSQWLDGLLLWKQSVHSASKAVTIVLCLQASTLVVAQEQVNSVPNAAEFKVTKTNQQLEMVVNSSQVIKLGEDIERVNLHNDKVLTVQPTGSREVLVTARATGFTQLDLYAPNNSVYSVQVVVLGDARELEAVLRAEFPMAALQVRPIQNAVIISGQVTSDEHVEQVIAIAEQYFPTVINRIGLLGVQTIMLRTQVMEISRTKLRELSVDWALGFGDDFVQQSVAGTVSATPLGSFGATGNSTVNVGILNNGNQFFTLIKALRQNNLIKVMADPVVVAVDGRPASFQSGGEFVFTTPGGQNQPPNVVFKDFGTRLDFVAKSRGNGRIWLEVRPTISEIDTARGQFVNGQFVPGIRNRFVDTAVELQAGQTLALAGLLQSRTETLSRGLPGLADVPYLGALFRSNVETQNEVELLILVTPDFAAPMDADQIPPGGPGFNTFSPSDHEFYWKGYMETPNPCPPASSEGVMDSETQSSVMMNGDYLSKGQTIPGQSMSTVNSKPASLPLTQPNSQQGTASPVGYRVSNGSNDPVVPSSNPVKR